MATRTTRSKPSDPAAPARPKPKRRRAAAAAERAPAGPTAAEPSADDIRRRAYERYQEHGGRHGHHVDDWIEAEKELRTKK